jgi:hypothetical protein
MLNPTDNRQNPKPRLHLKGLGLALGLASLGFLAACSTDSDDEEGLGKIQFQVEGEDITYDSLTGEDGYNHVKYATIEYAYMMVKGPKLNPEGHPAKQAAGQAAQHTGISFPGIHAVDLLKEAVLGTVDSVEAGSYTELPSISLYVPTAEERASIQDHDGALAHLPAGTSFRFGGMIYPKDGEPFRYEIRENVTALINVLEFPPEAGAGEELVVKKGKTLVAEFHPHIDHALEVICHDNVLDWSELETSGDTVLFTPDKNASYYEAIVGHITKGDHWDVNVVPE